MSATPVQVLMPPELLSRMESWLAMTGMRLYRVPVKDDLATFLIGVDMPAHEGQAVGGVWPAPIAVEAYADAVAYLTEPKTVKPKRRAKRATSTTRGGAR